MHPEHPAWLVLNSQEQQASKSASWVRHFVCKAWQWFSFKFWFSGSVELGANRQHKAETNLGKWHKWTANAGDTLGVRPMEASSVARSSTKCPCHLLEMRERKNVDNQDVLIVLIFYCRSRAPHALLGNTSVMAQCYQYSECRSVVASPSYSKPVSLPNKRKMQENRKGATLQLVVYGKAQCQGRHDMTTVNVVCPTASTKHSSH